MGISFSQFIFLDNSFFFLCLYVFHKFWKMWQEYLQIFHLSQYFNLRNHIHVRHFHVLYDFIPFSVVTFCSHLCLNIDIFYLYIFLFESFISALYILLLRSYIEFLISVINVFLILGFSFDCFTDIHYLIKFNLLSFVFECTSYFFEGSCLNTNIWIIH